MSARWVRRAFVVFVALGLAAATGRGLSSLVDADEFDHTAHAGLFVGCASCHVGIPTGDESRFTTVTAADCARCHDGTREDRVDWEAPLRRSTNLRFSHDKHGNELARAGEAELACASCHGTGGERIMNVGAAPADGCIGCHAHEAPEHLEAACETCHVPLTSATGLDPSRIRAFEVPADHEVSGFISEHGIGLEAGLAGDASCAVCHARESCVRCHLDADRQPAVQALLPDPRVAEFAGEAGGEWPAPAGHESAGFLFDHGTEGVESCATCHARPSCSSCHRDSSAPWLAELSRPAPDAPQGAQIAYDRPPGHTARFATEHAVAAGAQLPNCESCHAPAECADCHTAGRAEPRVGTTNDADPTSFATVGFRHVEPGYHVDNFVLRHGAEAFGVQATCSDCHSTEVFCRDCHTRAGVGVGRAEGALGAFHDTRGSWLIGHGASARMGLEACVSCHQQTSCLRCHSAKSGLRMNPHGPGFKADRLAARSTISCGVCHTADQVPRP